MMTKLKLLTSILLVFSFHSYSKELTVSKTGTGQFSSIQKAVTEAQSGDVITILDNAVYEERVVIENKSNLTLQSLFDNSSTVDKPTILWLDIVNVGPKTYPESQIDSLITFQKNGALLINNCSNILVTGLRINGKSPHPFGYPGIWNGRDPLFHGNSSVSILESGNISIRYCDIANAYFGIYINDKNEEGVFANANPSDIVIPNKPLSGFGKTGNHIIELNRIHNNSWGMFFESLWDLGSTIRFNQICENHHTDSLGRVVKGLPDGGNQPGGALLFKDDLFSPLAIYNNSFWHNHTIFAGHWAAGAQHLIFNNIFAQPYIFWSRNPNFQNPFMEMDGTFIYRIHNCLYSCQMQAPDMRTQTFHASIMDPATDTIVENTIQYSDIFRVPITNDLQAEVEGANVPIPLKLSTGDTVVYSRADWVVQPGALITRPTANSPFPKDAEVRWLEMKFKSTDPQSPDFLIPDLSDSVINKFTKNTGWKDAGIFNTDGKTADIGASIPFGIKKLIRNIVPLMPAYVLNDHIIAAFRLDQEPFPNPKIEYFKLVRNLKYQSTAFGPNIKPVQQSDIIQLPMNISLKSGVNLLEIPIPPSDTSDRFGFMEMVVSSKEGSSTLNSTGFIPYRKLPPLFEIKLFDFTTQNQITEVKKGDKVIIKISVDIKNPPVFKNVNIRLLSDAKIMHTDGSEFKIDSISSMQYTDTVVFNHSGKDIILISAEGSLDMRDLRPMSCSDIIDIIENTAGIHQRAIAKTIKSPANYVLFSLNGKKIGTFNTNQLSIQSLKGQQLPSGMYCAFPEADAIKGRMQSGSMKILIP
jgi:hypothetical protein